MECKVAQNTESSSFKDTLESFVKLMRQPLTVT
jgi:hypothetical protein